MRPDTAAKLQVHLDSLTAAGIQDQLAVKYRRVLRETTSATTKAVWVEQLSRLAPRLESHLRGTATRAWRSQGHPTPGRENIQVLATRAVRDTLARTGDILTRLQGSLIDRPNRQDFDAYLSRAGLTVESIIAHAEDRFTRSLAAKGNLATKTWRTSSADSRHANLDGVTIPVDGLFQIGASDVYGPRSLSLPVRESSGCKCYLEYSAEV